MRTVTSFKTVIVASAVLMATATASAQHRSWHHHCHPHRVTVVTQSATSAVSNSLSQKERLAMALAYLDANATLTVKKYADMTKLSKATAEAELDAFVADKAIPLRMIVNGKKKVYTKG